jgi:hypothetical protein
LAPHLLNQELKWCRSGHWTLCRRQTSCFSFRRQSRMTHTRIHMLHQLASWSSVVSQTLGSFGISGDFSSGTSCGNDGHFVGALRASESHDMWESCLPMVLPTCCSQLSLPTQCHWPHMSGHDLVWNSENITGENSIDVPDVHIWPSLFWFLLNERGSAAICSGVIGNRLSLSLSLSLSICSCIYIHTPIYPIPHPFNEVKKTSSRKIWSRAVFRSAGFNESLAEWRQIRKSFGYWLQCKKFPHIRPLFFITESKFPSGMIWDAIASVIWDNSHTFGQIKLHNHFWHLLTSFD